MKMKIKKGMVVKFAGSRFTVVKVNEKSLDIKQNFSIGVVYENISIEDIQLL